MKETTGNRIVSSELQCFQGQGKYTNMSVGRTSAGGTEQHEQCMREGSEQHERYEAEGMEQHEPR